MTKDEIKSKIEICLKVFPEIKNDCDNSGVNLKLYKMKKSELEETLSFCEQKYKEYEEKISKKQTKYGHLPITAQIGFLHRKNYRKISKTYWERMVKKMKENENWICGHCGEDMSNLKNQYHAHEIFNVEIDDDKKEIIVYAKEIRLMCQTCHNCYHLGYSVINGFLNDQLIHAIKVNMKTHDNDTLKENQFIYRCGKLNNSISNEELKHLFYVLCYNIKFIAPSWFPEHEKWEKSCERFSKKLNDERDKFVDSFIQEKYEILINQKRS